MPRPNKVWKRKGTDWYYAKVGGKKVRLATDRAEAERLMHRLLAEEKPAEAVNAAVFPTFRKLADDFLARSQRDNQPNTFKMHRIYLQSFVTRVKGKRVNDLKVRDVADWIASTGWGESTACSGRGTVLAVLNAAVELGDIPHHPLKALKRGSHKRRERVFTTDELTRIKAFTNPFFADFLVGLELTGARPYSELAKVTAAMVDWDKKTITFAEHKNEKKGKTRTIYLVPDMLTLLRRLAKQHPTGLLFRNTRAKIWASHDATRRLHYCTGKLGIPRGTIYAVRHKVISDGLEKGLNANVIAELVGNSPVTISRHYDHLSKRRAAMLEAAQRVVS